MPLLALVCAGCEALPALQRPPTLGEVAALVAVGLLLNTLVGAALLLGWERARRTGRLRAALLRELDYLRRWPTEEGVLRKAGLLRDLNALGSVPEELEGCELEGADLKGVRLTGCSLRGANLAGADLQGAVLDGADLFGCALPGANLALASLDGANLRGCDLDGALLMKANLRAASLQRASLVQANLHGANLEGALLGQARFARPEQGPLRTTVHASVDDWIRERLDGEGRYQEHGPPPHVAPLHEAG